MNRIEATLPIVFLAAVVAQSGGGQIRKTRSEPEPRPTMRALARAFALVESGLTGSTDVSAPSRLLVKQANLVSTKLSAKHRGDAAVAHLVAEFVAAATDLDLAARNRDPRAVTDALADIRASCVACHVITRGPTRTKSPFPAKLNTVAGRIKVLGPTRASFGDGQVVVFLEPLDRRIETRLPRRPPEISQKGRRFEPSVLPVVVGSTVLFPNDDKVFHNVFSLSRPRPFDLGVYGVGKQKSVKFEKPGLVRIYCNIHPEMAAAVLVLPNHHFAVVDANGTFVIPEVPDGKYVVRAWSDVGEEREARVHLKGATVSIVNFEIKANRRRLPHKNKFGKDYRRKY